MARELSIEFEVLGSSEADAAIARLALGLQKAGNSALEAADKAEKFEKSYKEGVARKQATRELDALTGATKETAKVTDMLTSAVLRYVGPAVVVDAIRRTVDWADRVGELAEQTSLSVESVQRLSKMAEKNGSNFGTMAGLIQTVEQRLASHNKQAENTVRLMGMAPEALLAMDPLERLRAIAKGLADIEDPAQRSAYETAILGKKADGAAAALRALANGADQTESALGPGFIKAGQDAQDMLDTIINKATDAGKAMLLFAFAARRYDGGAAFLNAGGELPKLPAARGGFGMPTPLAVPGDPFAPGALGGNSIDYIEQTLRLPKGALGGGRAAKGPAKVLPFVPRNLMGTSMASIFAMGNTPGSFSAGRFPFQTSVMPIAAGGSPISFANGSGLASTVGMNAPGGQGGFMNFLRGRGGAIAGAGLSAITQMFGGKLGLSATGQGIGSLVGSFIPGLGPLGSALGGLAGGLFGKLFGGGDSKAIKGAMGGADFKQLQAEAERLGISMDKVFTAKKVKDFEKAVADVSKRIGEQKDESERVQQAMDRWGLTIEDMGTKFQQNKMNETALSLAQDFVDLGNAGADTTKLLEKMAPTLSDFIAKSKTMGTEVPREMQPVLQAAQKAGLLFDENGEKLTDEAFASITWAQTMTQGFDKVESAINRLTEAILGMGTAFDRSADAASDFADAAGRAGNITTQPVGDAVGFTSGGMAGRDFRRAGYGDVFPALLRRGETVLPAGVHRGGVSINGDIHVSGGYGSRSDAVEEIGEAVVKYMERRGARLVA